MNLQWFSDRTLDREANLVRAMAVQTYDVKIGIESSFAKSSAFRSDNHGSFGYDLIIKRKFPVQVVGIHPNFVRKFCQNRVK
jgi:hypothetical protein